MDKAAMKDAAMVLINDCKTKVGATDADLEMLKMKKIPETQEGLCLIECILNTVKMMENGKFSKDGAIQAITPAMKGDDEKIGKMKKMMDVCEKEIGEGDSDPCKTAKLIVECTSKHGPEYGFNYPNGV